jgi:hypothetical protein
MVNFVADSESLRSNVVIDNLKQIRRRQRTDEYSERHDIEHIYSVNIFEYEKAIYRRRRQPHTGRDQLATEWHPFNGWNSVPRQHSLALNSFHVSLK